MRWGHLPLLVATIAMVGFGVSGTIAAGDPPPDDPGRPLWAGRFALARELFRLRVKDHGNLAISPHAVATQLMAIWRYSGPKERQAVERLLRFGIGAGAGSDLNQQLKSYGELLVAIDRHEGTSSFTYQFGSTILFRKGNPLPEALEIELRDTYRVDPLAIDVGDPALAQRAMNDWFAKRAGISNGGAIAAVVMPDVSHVSYLAALRFVSEWETPFDDRDTKTGSFLNAVGPPRPVPLMREYVESREIEPVAGAEWLSLTVAGCEFELLIGLPIAPETTETVAASLTEDHLEYLTRDYLDPRRPPLDRLKWYTEVILPRFSVESSVELGTNLDELGLGILRGGAGAEIDARHPLSLGSLCHRCSIAVDEKGLGAPGGKKRPLSRPAVLDRLNKKRRGEFYATRPFLFMLFHHDSRAVMLVGRIDSLGAP